MTLDQEIAVGRTELAFAREEKKRKLGIGARGHGSPMSEMAEAFLPKLRFVALRTDRRILIAGCKSSNIGMQHQNHPLLKRLVLWGSNQEGRFKNGTIPKDVGAILLLRWMSHQLSNKLIAEAKERQIPYCGIISTGDVRQLLELAFIPEEVVEATTTDPVFAEAISSRAKTAEDRVLEEVRLKGLWNKTLATEPVPDPLPPTIEAEGESRTTRLKGIARVLQSLNPRLDTVPLTDEARRLLPEVQKVYPEATATHIAGTLHYLRNKAPAPATSEPVVEVAPAPAPPPVEAPAPVQAAPVPTLPVVAEPVATPAGEAIEQALQAIAAAERALASARAALTTARADMVTSIVRAVEDGVLEAIASATSKFRR